MLFNLFTIKKTFEVYMSKKEDIDFLYARLEKLQKLLIVIESSTENNCVWDPEALPRPDPEAERVACIADGVKVDGSIFMDLIPCPEYNFNEMQSRSIRILNKQIKTIGLILAKINNSDETKQGWHIENGQVFYDGKDLQFPSGQIQEVLQKLVESEGKTVRYVELERITTLEKIRHYKSNIVKLINSHNLPFEIKTLTSEGYVLQKKQGS